MDYPDILSIRPDPREFAYDQDYTILYALGLGVGGSPDDLSFVYEKGLAALPTMAVLMGSSTGDFITGGGINYAMIVHGEQRLTIHKPLPPSGRMITRTCCLGVVDKGKKRGALVNIESVVMDAASGEDHATSVTTLFCRGDGGFSGPADGELPVHGVPVRLHDYEVELPTLPQQAALYRLLGDKNPLHIDPALASRVGFDRPILHGLCTYGIACRAIMTACCGNDPAAIERFDARFSAPVFPGETIVTRIWRDGNVISFECMAAGRSEPVIRNGLCVLRSH